MAVKQNILAFPVRPRPPEHQEVYALFLTLLREGRGRTLSVPEMRDIQLAAGFLLDNSTDEGFRFKLRSGLRGLQKEIEKKRA